MSKIIRFPRSRRKKREINVLPLSQILEEVLFGKRKKNRKKNAETDHEKDR